MMHYATLSEMSDDGAKTPLRGDLISFRSKSTLKHGAHSARITIKINITYDGPVPEMQLLTIALV